MQEYTMCVSIGACLIMMVFTFITDSLSKRRKHLLFSLSATVMVQSISDQLADYFNGNTNSLAMVMTRASKFLVYGANILFVYIFCLYLKDLLSAKRKNGEPPKTIKVAEYLLSVGAIILTISQFTGLYYTFDSNNNYIRGSGYAISYLFPMTATILLLITTIRHRGSIRKRLIVPFVVFMATPLLTSVVRFISHEIALTSISVTGMVAMLYCFSILDANDLAKIAYQKEIELVKQTTFALVEAIDAKDSYTNGHSKRVAEYSVKIGEKAGKSKEELEELYLVALLHDVGKIGIPNAIINKNGKLTDEEYDIIKTHPVIGNEILSKISISPELAIGAHFHHERYDGKGYPAGLFGHEIPELARIIAVADAYDAMSSRRSYRDVLPKEIVRNELEKSIGTQLDPEFAKIMIDLMDSDEEYQMREK